MISLGDTFFGSLFGRDPNGHLWIIVSTPTSDDRVAAVNLTTHRPGRLWHSESCLILDPSAHPFIVRDSCVAYIYADMAMVAELEGNIGRELDRREPLSQQQLQRIQDGALASPDVPPNVKAAIRASRSKDS